MFRSIENTNDAPGKQPVTAKLLAMLPALLCALLLGALSVCFADSLAPSEAYAAGTVTVKVDGLSTTLPSLVYGRDYTLGDPIGSQPVEYTDATGKQPLKTLTVSKNAQGYDLVWYTNAAPSTPFSWEKTPMTAAVTSITGKWVKMTCEVTVSHGYNDGTKSKTVKVPWGMSYKSVSAVPTAPTRAGYTFNGWIDLGNGGAPFDFNAPVKKSTTVEASWSLTDPLAATDDVNFNDIPKTDSGTCYIGDTWGWHPAQFALSNFSGYLKGTSGVGSCTLATAAPPQNVTANYTATLTKIDIENSEVVYNVNITPPDAATPNGPRNQYGLIGYQTVGFEAHVKKNFGGWVELYKASKDTQITDDNPMYSLNDAQFAVYTDQDCTNQKTMLTTNADGYVKSGLLPAGTYYIKETAAPNGYALDAEVHAVTIKSGETARVDITDEAQGDFSLNVQKVDEQSGAEKQEGGATLAGAVFSVKYYSVSNAADKDNAKIKRTWYVVTDENGNATLDSVKTGKATFDHIIGDTKYSIDLSSDDLYKKNDKPVIPLGIVEVQEIVPPNGYLLDNGKYIRNKGQLGSVLGKVQTFTINGNRTSVSIDMKQINKVNVNDRVIRGDVTFKKNEAISNKSMPGIPFVIESITTGEKHLVVTDDNGVIRTDNEWSQHTNLANSNDQYLTTDGNGKYKITDESKLDPNCGVYFTGYKEGSSEGKNVRTDDNNGAFPYDTYKVTEVQCSANEGYTMIERMITVNRESSRVPDDTWFNHAYKIHTTATDSSTGDHLGLADDTKKITKLDDEVTYSGLAAGKKYTMSGVLMDKETGEALLDENGNKITASTEFIAENGGEGSVTVTFEIPTSIIKGKTTVVFESLLDNGTEITSHADINDEGQTVTYPEIHTTATDSVTGNHEGSSVDDKATINDKVEYSGLIAGKEYKIIGVLMDKETGEAIVGENGETFTVEKTFTADESSGGIELSFEVPSSVIAGKTAVVFENAYKDNVLIAVHADINDADQTVHYPAIHTTATDSVTGDHEGLADDGKLIINDEVSYTNLTKGETYTVTGVLKDKKTGESLLDENGKEITSTTTFVAGEEQKNNESSADDTADNDNKNDEATDDKDNGSSDENKTDDSKDTKLISGTVTVSFGFDGSLVKGKQTVIFEDLYRGENDFSVKANVARHADIGDEGQEVDYPVLHTTATVNGEHTATAADNIDLTDVIAYTNLDPGKTYRAEGRLVSKATGEAITGGSTGEAVMSSVEFVPESENGTVSVEFSFDGSKLGGTDTVVFENLYKVGAGINGEDARVGKHEDLSDAGQTVHFNEADLAEDIVATGDITPYAIAGGALIALIAAGGTLFIRRKRA